MTLKNWMKIEAAKSKNVKGRVFFHFFAKTLGGYFGGPKMDLNNSKGKNECTPREGLKKINGFNPPTHP